MKVRYKEAQTLTFGDLSSGTYFTTGGTTLFLKTASRLCEKANAVRLGEDEAFLLFIADDVRVSRTLNFVLVEE